MNDLFNVVTTPLKKIAMLIFSLEINIGSANTNLGSIIIVGSIFVVLIGIITHASASGRLSGLIAKIKAKKNG